MTKEDNPEISRISKEAWKKGRKETEETEQHQGKMSGLIPPASEEEESELERLRQIGNTPI